DRERHPRVHAVVARVRRHEMSAARVLMLELARHRRVEGREEDAALELVPGGAHAELGDIGWDAGRELPPGADSLRVGTPGALVGRQDLDDLEPGMPFEQLDEPLPDRARAAEHGNRDLPARPR